MAIKRKIQDDEGIYFITFTCWKWLPLFELVSGYDLVYKWFDILKTDGNKICGYVIMPNHLHILVHFKKIKKSIHQTISNGKRFLAYSLIKRLREHNHLDILLELEFGVKNSDRKKGKRHQVFKHSFDWKACKAAWFTNQKLAYIHKNPCTGKWRLSPDPASYMHSSARYYEEGIHSCYPVTHIDEA